jgi:hypothetical protein
VSKINDDIADRLAATGEYKTRGHIVLGNSPVVFHADLS